MIDSLDPAPCITIVSSFVTIIFLANPKTVGSAFSRVRPISSVITVPPVRMAISLRIAFLLSPNAGAFTAATFNYPLSLLSTS